MVLICWSVWCYYTKCKKKLLNNCLYCFKLGIIHNLFIKVDWTWFMQLFWNIHFTYYIQKIPHENIWNRNARRGEIAINRLGNVPDIFFTTLCSWLILPVAFFCQKNAKLCATLMLYTKHSEYTNFSCLSVKFWCPAKYCLFIYNSKLNKYSCRIDSSIASYNISHRNLYFTLLIAKASNHVDRRE